MCLLFPNTEGQTGGCAYFFFVPGWMEDYLYLDLVYWKMSQHRIRIEDIVTSVPALSDCDKQTELVNSVKSITLSITTSNI